MQNYAKKDKVYNVYSEVMCNTCFETDKLISLQVPYVSLKAAINICLFLMTFAFQFFSFV